MSRTPSLRSRAISAGLWTVGGQAAAQILRLGSNLVMTRLLVPEMFGVMAVAWTVIFAIGMFSDIGLSQSVVRSSRGEDPRFLNTAWTVQIYRGAVLTCVTLLVAGILALAGHFRWLPASSTYAHPDVPGVLAAISLTVLIGGFRSIKFITASRKLALRRTTAIELAGQILGFGAMVLMAQFKPTVYVLVFGALISGLFEVLASHLILPGPTARFDWERETLSEIREFGRWIMVTSIMGFMIRVGDRVFMGWLLSAPMMGLYMIAAIMAGVPQLILSRVMSSVALPSLAETFRKDPSRMKTLYYRIRLPVDAFCLLTAGLLFVAGEPINKLLYDDRYLGAGAMLEVLALMLFASRYGVTNQFYLVLGKPKVMATLMAIRICTMAFAVPVGFAWAGPIGAVWGVVLSPALELLWAVFFYQRRLGIFDGMRELMSLLFLPVGMSLGWALGWLLGAVGLI